MIEGIGMENLRKLAWLSGYWEARKSEYVVTEQWMQPEGGSMFAVNRTVKSGKTITYEYMRIQSGSEEFSTSLFILPAGQCEVEFKLVDFSEKLVIFENSRHDFPQRVTYKLDSDGNLFCCAATLDGKEGDGIVIRLSPVVFQTEIANLNGEDHENG
jgi:hypothetical protein